MMLKSLSVRDLEKRAGCDTRGCEGIRSMAGVFSMILVHRGPPESEIEVVLTVSPDVAGVRFRDWADSLHKDEP